MKKTVLILSFMMLVIPTYSHAWSWPWSKKVEVIAPDPALEIQVMERSSNFNKLVRQLPNHKQFVMCADCPTGMPLTREMTKPNVAIRMSTPPSGRKQTSEQPEQPAHAVVVTASAETTPPVPNENPAERAPSQADPEPAKPESENQTAHEKSTTICAPPIHFELDRSVITKAEMDRIKSAEQVLKKSNHIEVRGYTCDIGSKKYNDKLALDRANAVADVLKQMGITPVSVNAEGKCCYVSEDKPQNRRVEITCIQNP